MPEKTLNALADHGNGAPTIKGTYEESHAMAKLAELASTSRLSLTSWKPTASLPSSSPDWVLTTSRLASTASTAELLA
ncbi:MAG: hypothetical protein ACLUB5_00890 [Bifidobacterium dentium]